MTVISGLLDVQLEVCIPEQNVHLVLVSTADNTREQTGAIHVELWIVMLEGLA